MPKRPSELFDCHDIRRKLSAADFVGIREETGHEKNGIYNG